ncbi:MAG: MAE_28990/MAE_18760 family HEPN-like nuclease [Defluviitaleaceae bacterium]|nr:MAE_28990/MAE_18760 family HEPN-like nuclease [Defluviitaleaceae bacterium]
MRVRNIEELQNEIDNDVAWRKKEISELYLSFQSSNSAASMARACFVMLCAHFEGAIRHSSNAYVTYVSEQNVNGAELKPEIISIILRKKKHHLFNHTGQKKVKISSVLDLIKSYEEMMNVDFSVRVGNNDIITGDSDFVYIPTEGNPTPEVLSEIANILCLDYESLFRLRENYINFELLKPRHGVAHGEKRPISKDELNAARSFVLDIVDEYTGAIMSAATNFAYKRLSCELQQS